MTNSNWAVFRTLLHQVGWRRALGLTLMKALRRVLAPHFQFHYSQTGEDLVLDFLKRRYIGDSRALTYVDVGCHDPRRISSTYLQYLAGASGVCVDMDPKHARHFRAERPRDVFVCAAVSDSIAKVTVHEFASSEVNTINADQAVEWAKRWVPTGTREMESVTLYELLQESTPGRAFDLLHLDVEGQELQVLRGANLDVFRPGIVICEIHGIDLSSTMSNPVVEFLSEKRFSMVAYATMNGYFVCDELRDRFDR